MISRDEAEQLLGDSVVVETIDGDDLGPLRRIFLDEYTGWPSFATVGLDPDSSVETFVALHEVDYDEVKLTLPYGLDRVRHAPTVHASDDLTTGEEDDLFDYYDVPIEGVQPSVSHLGSALVPEDDGDVTETPTESEPS